MLEPSPGVKVLELIPRRPDISIERFHYYWGVLHPRVSHRVKPMVRYVQHHRISDGVPGLPALALDGITEAWFESYASAQSGFQDPVFVTEGFPLMEKYIDLPHSTWLFLHEEVSVDTADEGHPSARVIIELRRRADLDQTEFEAALRGVSEQAARLPQLTRLANFFRAPEAEADVTPGNYDAAILLAFPDLEVLEEAWVAPQAGVRLVAALAEFSDLDRSGALVAHAIKVK